jgi:hypothetical protein
MKEQSLREWMGKVQGNGLVCIPTFHKGWITFFFKNGEDLEKIRSENWYWVNTLSILKLWTPCFNPRVERISVLPIWVKMPMLPLEF